MNHLLKISFISFIFAVPLDQGTMFFSPEDSCVDTGLCEQQQVEVETINIAPDQSDTELIETNFQQTLTDEAVKLINQCQQLSSTDAPAVSVPEQTTGLQLQHVAGEEYTLPEVPQQPLVFVDHNLNTEALELINQWQNLEMANPATILPPAEHINNSEATVVSDVGTILQSIEPVSDLPGVHVSKNVLEEQLSSVQTDKSAMQHSDSVEVPIVVNTNVGTSHKSVIEIPIMLKSDHSCNNESHNNQSPNSGEGNGQKIVVQISIPQNSCSTHCHNENTNVCQTNIDAMKIEVKDEKDKVIKIKLQNTNDKNDS